MASLGSEVAKDLVQVGEGVVTEVIEDVSNKTDAPVATSVTSKPNLFFRFGQIIGGAVVSLVCCACKKAQAKTEPAPVESPPKPK
jgi:hypothetical protein